MSNKPKDMTKNSAESMADSGHTFIKTDKGVDVGGFVLEQPETLKIPSQETTYGPTTLNDPCKEAQDAAQEPNLIERVVIAEEKLAALEAKYGTLEVIVKHNSGGIDRILADIANLTMILCKR